MTFEETYEFVQAFDKQVSKLDPVWQKIMSYWRKDNLQSLDLDRGWKNIDHIGTGKQYCTDPQLGMLSISGVIFNMIAEGTHPNCLKKGFCVTKKVSLSKTAANKYMTAKELFLKDLSPLRILPDLTYLDLENV